MKKFETIEATKPIKVHVNFGDVNDAIDESIQLATLLDCEVQLKFNNVNIRINKKLCAGAALEFYLSFLK